jgi:hypothetical protein
MGAQLYTHVHTTHIHTTHAHTTHTHTTHAHTTHVHTTHAHTTHIITLITATNSYLQHFLLVEYMLQLVSPDY